MTEWLRRLFGTRSQVQNPAGGIPPAASPGIVGAPDPTGWADEDEEESIICPVCEHNVQEHGPCPHVVCAYEPQQEPIPAEAISLTHFLHSRLDMMVMERLFRSVSTYAQSHPERQQWKELPELLRGMVSSVWKREVRTGAGVFAVPCDAWDDYLTTLLHGCEGYMGGEALDAYGVEGDRVATIVFHIHFAQDVPDVVEKITRTMKEDILLLEQLQSTQAQVPIPPRPERRPLPERSDYFPRSVFGDEDALRISWYGAMLQSLEEPSLWQQSQADSSLHAYRFLWLRTFDAPIAVRLTLGQAAGKELVWKVADGAGGYEGGDLDLEESRSVSDEEAKAFLSLLERSDFWRLPSSDERLGMDGAHWILEGVQKGHYHLMDRWSPEEGAFREAALTLVRLTNLSLDSTDVY